MDDCDHDQANKRRRFSNNNDSLPENDSISSQQLQPQPMVETENRFDLLADMDPDEVRSTNVNINSQVASTINTKTCRLPPISIINIGTKQTRKLWNLANIPQTEYHMKAVKSGTQLTVSNEDYFNAAIKALSDGNKEFFTHTPTSKQPVTYHSFWAAVVRSGWIEGGIALAWCSPTRNESVFQQSVRLWGECAVSSVLWKRFGKTHWAPENHWLV